MRKAVLPEDLRPTDTEEPRHLHRVADHLPEPVPLGRRPEGAGDDGGADDLQDRTLLEAEPAVEEPLLVGDGPRLGPALLEEGVPLLDAPLVEEKDFRGPRVLRGETAQVADLLAQNGQPKCRRKTRRWSFVSPPAGPLACRGGGSGPRPAWRGATPGSFSSAQNTPGDLLEARDELPRLRMLQHFPYKSNHFPKE